MGTTTAEPPADAPPTGEDDELARKRAEAEANGRAHEGEGGGEEHLDGEGEEAAPEVPQLAIEGLGESLTNKIGGQKPDKATVKLQGGSIGIPKGQYEPGDTVDLLVRVRCTSVEIVDKLDGNSGQVTERERRHKFRVTNVEKTG